ncbi:NADH:ubiquinone reductase (Na(+)-transporting) subunit C [Chlamydia muridarum str. Nigg]|jgi:NADH:ubiquinone oxidoreductase, Na(+)-translocating, C subunit|uniref:Na(+)-translocating NADH-quinone reductase subunit C n=2 Tax=Chlamydia muridarum TaxID=83560 RepID=NQRC_CHLMU|nr:Na(+)-translocating NADH-quinone reductase subunit C [Chlamydia muridarum]Q9PKB5.1 RecName: Full=Na(+)-translocating NADH-quinone reductase subunit C; Short=Na(+)-NQR subunit C; Short=Na(+)-translocating NQR subunit C; AltName: Full=NQR complex subunit C; AltName: Full=NQR-1 subunit C [Chlamydia muridarum str. Nigg]UFW37693.1 Na(+)-translocating NADH-quinone reductase subunit C [Chlamydia trachomatis]AAF39390.1 NADH:ubiquinone oxidoreductase, gamma subunit, putative [Chlamydia muridarum str. 
MASKSRHYLNQPWYIILFIFVLSLVAGTLLSSVSYVLSPIQKQAAEFDRNQQMLMAAQIISYDNKFQIYAEGDWQPAVYNTKKQILEKSSSTPPQVTVATLCSYFQNFVRVLLTDSQGNLSSFEDHNLNLEEFLSHPTSSVQDHSLHVIYAILANDESSKKLSSSQVAKNPVSIESIILPIKGFGLWGPIYGFLALEKDGNTVLGTCWYQHGETPGLGANITNPQWQQNFRGKKVFLASSSGETDFAKTTLGLEVIKGSVSALLGDSPKANSAVDGISGATLTCNGVTEAFANSLAPYRPLLTFFANLNSSGESHDNQ